MRLFFFRFPAELYPVQLRIQAVFRHQLVVGAGLADALAVDVQDLVRPADGGQPVGDHQRRPPGGELVEGGLDARLGHRIERRRRFVDYFMDYLPLPQNRLFLVYTLLCLLSPTSQQKVKALDKKRMARVRAMRF